jgi:hypothetical protein
MIAALLASALLFTPAPHIPIDVAQNWMRAGMKKCGCELASGYLIGYAEDNQPRTLITTRGPVESEIPNLGGWPLSRRNFCAAMKASFDGGRLQAFPDVLHKEIVRIE